MEEVDKDEIVRELKNLRADLETNPSLSSIENVKKGSEWSAHANWKSSSESLPCDFSLRKPTSQSS